MNANKKSGLLVLIMFYFVYVFVGVLLIKFPEIETLNPIEYLPLLFYMFGFFSMLAYFITRRKKDYELLLFGLINMISGTIVLFCSYDIDVSLLLSKIILIYSLLVVINKGYHTYVLSKLRDIKMFPKLTNTILLMILGFLTFSNLVSGSTMVTLMIGYYVFVFGILSLIEISLDILIIENKKLNKYLTSLIDNK